MNRRDRGLRIALAALVCGVGAVAMPAVAQSGTQSPSVSGSVRIDGSLGSVEIRFGDDQRRAVRDYYGSRGGGGSCPPGLARKGNGCQPPGQAKAWKVGRPLPSGVATSALPRDLDRRLGPPPAGYRYVQVATDILMIAVGTGLVVDAIENLSDR